MADFLQSVMGGVQNNLQGQANSLPKPAPTNSNPFGTATTQSNANPFVSSTPFGTASNPFAPTSTPGGFSNPFMANGSNTENMYSAPGSSTLNLGSVPNATPSTFQISPQVQTMLNGMGGFSPQTLGYMTASAKESAANAGQQQMAQVKRQMAQNGIESSPAAAGYAGAVAKQTGQQQQFNLGQVAQENAQAALDQQNMAAQLDQQARQGNMNAANTLAIQNAQMLYNAMLANQQARLGTQFNIYGTPGA